MILDVCVKWQAIILSSFFSFFICFVLGQQDYASTHISFTGVGQFISLQWAVFKR